MIAFEAGLRILPRMSEDPPQRPVSFGDNVRIRSMPLTVERGLAGLRGQVYGETTPSMTGVDVIGELHADFAVNVHLAEKGEAYWFAEELIEFLDHAPGTEICLEGVPKKWTRSASGEWIEERMEPPNERRPWWKFW
jgi:hypothetical protein